MRHQPERREVPRTPGRFNDALNAAYALMREVEAESKPPRPSQK